MTNPASCAIRSPSPTVDWDAIARLVNRMIESCVPKKITANTRAKAWTGLSGSSGRSRETRSRTGLEASAAAIEAVTMKPTSRGMRLWPPGSVIRRPAPAASRAPTRKVMPAVTPVRIAIAWCAHERPTAAFAVMINGSGKSTFAAVEAASRRRWPLSPIWNPS
jgi:hypothetical protein